jgi:hypothetical protein
MPVLRPALYAFNRGIVSSTALGRVDIERLRLSAAKQTNWFPRSLGPMSLRPGTEYLLSTLGDQKARYIPFFFSTTQKALLECTASFLRPLVNDAVITRPSVASAVTNGDFASATGWTIAGVGGGSGAIDGGYLAFSCVPIESSATCSRTMTVASGDQNVEHAFRIDILRGPVTFRCGSTSGGEDYIGTTTLNTGVHSLAFTPTGGTVHIQFESRLPRIVAVNSIQIEAAGALTLPTPWDSDTRLENLRWAQSGDIVYTVCFGLQERRIERRSARSWSIVLSEPLDGPFAAVPEVDNVKLSINAARGNATLTASRAYFNSDMVGSLFRFFTPGYNFTFQLAQNDVFTPAIRVNGVGAGRNVTVTTTGSWLGGGAVLTVQKSFISEETGFYAVDTISSNTDTTVSDTSDNNVMWVRVGFRPGGYVSGTASVTLTFGDDGGASFAPNLSTAQGGLTGVCRVNSVTTPTAAAVDIITSFSSNRSNSDWVRSEWSERSGWPSAIGFHEGRLFRAGRDRVWGSVSDAFMSFNPAVEGDSGPIQRSIGYGPVQTINWVLPLTRLILGTEAAEVAVRSSSFDEPLTPTNFSMKDVSTYGSARLPSVKVDNRGIYVERSGSRVMELLYQVEATDFISRDLTQITPDLNQGNPIVDIVVQRQPDTRVHCIRTDGTVAILINEPAEDVRAWVLFETDGVVEGAVVLPGSEEDEVYYVVRRVIGGVTKRYLERFAMESECVGGTLNKQADCFKVYSGSATATITGLSHLNGKQVIVWANGKDFSPDNGAGVQTTYTVTSGQITLPSAVSNAVVGLPYTADYQSAKLAYAAAGGTALTRRKTIRQIGLLLNKTHHKGLYFGTDFDVMDGLPGVEDAAIVAADTIYEEYDHDMTTMPRTWDTDTRLCLRAKAPRPCTVVAAVIDIETHG